MRDGFGREIDYMRVSVTDRCDLRCRYCMPEGIEKVPMSRILTYEEIERICRVSASLGIRKIKITGGEPLVRLGCVDLIRSLKATEGIEQVTMTTNGQILEKYIDELRDTGMDGINISLDSLRPDRYEYITGRGKLENTLRSIDLSIASGIKTKVNCLPQHGFNEDELTDLASLAWDKGIDVRFIELMPIGIGDPAKGMSNEDVLAVLRKEWPDLEPDDSVHGNGPAVYYRRTGIPGAVGLISAMHGPFCSGCNRIRLTSMGQIKPCLCYEDETDIRPYLEKSDDELREAVRKAILGKPKAHCFDGRKSNIEPRLMAQIGG